MLLLSLAMLLLLFHAFTLFHSFLRFYGFSAVYAWILVPKTVVHCFTLVTRVTPFPQVLHVLRFLRFMHRVTLGLRPVPEK